MTNTAQKMKFSIKDFSSKCDQIRSFRRIWSHLLEKSLMEHFTFCAVQWIENDLLPSIQPVKKYFETTKIFMLF